LKNNSTVIKLINILRGVFFALKSEYRAEFPPNCEDSEIKENFCKFMLDAPFLHMCHVTTEHIM